MEIERRQLIDDDTHWYILSHTTVDTGSQTVQNQGIQGTNHLFLFRVISDNQIAWIFRV